MRSITGLPDNDFDRATYLGNARATSHAPLEHELSPAEMAAEVRRICLPILDRIRGAEQSAHRCKHQINLEKSACGICRRENGRIA